MESSYDPHVQNVELGRSDEREYRDSAHHPSASRCPLSAHFGAVAVKRLPRLTLPHADDLVPTPTAVSPC